MSTSVLEPVTESTIIERPILMSGQMVRALLAERKTQTRRVLNLDKAWHDGPEYIVEWRQQNGTWFGLNGYQTIASCKCPYGKPGDRLWVRENGWQRPERTLNDMREGADTWPPYFYDADEYRTEWCRKLGWIRRPSIHMPRWASRILLEITEIRVERLRSISEEDARAEGVQDFAHVGAVNAFESLWEQINGTKSLESNPWVWVVVFKAIRKGN